MDNSEGGLPIDHEPDRHADRREAVHKVGSAVERIHEPSDIGPLAAFLLTEERDLRRCPFERFPDRSLARKVSVADEVARVLLADVLRRGEPIADERSRSDCGIHCDRKEVVEVEGHESSTARSAARSSGVPAATGWRRAVGLVTTSSRSCASTTCAPLSEHTSWPPR